MRRVASTDGVDLAVHDLGGHGPTILYSHATGFHGRVWLPLAACLAGRYHGVAPDYRGHGDSTRPADGLLDWRGYGEDCAAVVAALGLHRPFGVGHSKGGASLLMCELAHPGTFRALVLYEPVIYPPMSDDPAAVGTDRGADMVANTLRRRTTFPSYADALANFASKPPMNACAPEALEAYVRYGFAEQADGSVVLKCDPEHEAATYDSARRHSLWDDLGHVGCPVLLLAGSPDDPGPSQVAPEAAALIPGARFHRLAGLGHFGPLEDPAGVAAEVAAFFAALPADVDGTS